MVLFTPGFSRVSRNAKTANRSLDVRHLAKGVCRKKDFSAQLCGISVPLWWNYSRKNQPQQHPRSHREAQSLFFRQTPSRAGESTIRKPLKRFPAFFSSTHRAEGRCE